MATLERRISALEGGKPSKGSGVLVRLPGETEVQALQRAGPGSYLLMPAPMLAADWEKMVALQQSELLQGRYATDMPGTTGADA